MNCITLLHLFHLEDCSLPIPHDYIDVLRFTDTDVKGQSALVDCWVTDPTSNQIRGPRVGKTTFNVRMIIPKKGWVMQNGRPTKLEETQQGPNSSG